MKILWLVNIPLPEVSLLMGEDPSPFGGWLVNTSKKISQHENIQLSVAFPTSLKNSNKIEGHNINYYPFSTVEPSDNRAIEKNTQFQEILKETAPDIVHIYGTEYAHTLSMINTCNEKK